MYCCPMSTYIYIYMSAKTLMSLILELVKNRTQMRNLEQMLIEQIHKRIELVTGL